VRLRSAVLALAVAVLAAPTAMGSPASKPVIAFASQKTTIRLTCFGAHRLNREDFPCNEQTKLVIVRRGQNIGLPTMIQYGCAVNGMSWGARVITHRNIYDLPCGVDPSTWRNVFPRPAPLPIPSLIRPWYERLKLDVIGKFCSWIQQVGNRPINRHGRKAHLHCNRYNYKSVDANISRVTMRFMCRRPVPLKKQPGRVTLFSAADGNTAVVEVIRCNGMRKLYLNRRY
jgi:hypothetical protein